MSCLPGCITLPTPFVLPPWISVAPAGSYFDNEIQRRCDEVVPGTIVEYYAIYRFNVTTGALVSVTNTDLVGAPYVPINPVDCPQATTTNMDRAYTPRTSSVMVGPAGFTIPAPAIPEQLRSWSLLVQAGTVTLTNGPDAGSTFPAVGNYSFAAPVAAPGTERGYLDYLPAFTSVAGSSYIVLWTEG